MALPTTGSTISLNQVNVELALTGTTAIQMNQTTVRTLFVKPSGAIAMSDGHGKSNGPPAVASVVVYGSTSYFWYLDPAWSVLITYSNSTTSTDCTLLTWGQFIGTFNTGTVVGSRALVVTAANVKLSPTGYTGGGTGYIRAVASNGIAGYLNVTWSCLPLTTLITMADNTQKSMGNIKVGDMVKAINPETYELSNEKVTFVLDTNTSYNLIRITCANNNTIEPTPEHEVWVRRDGITMWVEAKDVLVDDELLSENLLYKKVLSVTPIFYSGGIEVGNISIANAKVYFAERLLMHNTG